MDSIDARSAPSETAPVPRRRRRWLAPVGAAAAVVALAVALVLVRLLQNGPVDSQSPAAPIAGVPEYYAAIDWLPKYGAQGVTVGDTFTSKTIAVVPPPAHTELNIVAAAGDDRTFVAYGQSTVHAGAAGTWYKLTLAPGTVRFFQLTRLPINQLGSLDAMALSASGHELAVVTTDSALTKDDLNVYSTATGRLLRTWSTTNRLAFSNGYSVETLAPAFAWTDGDRAITFPALRAVTQPHSGQTTYVQEVRTLTLASRGSDLMSDSQVLWSTSAQPSPPSKYVVLPVQTAYPGGKPGPMPCGEWYPAVGADGKTATCVVATGRDNRAPWTTTWRTYALPDQRADTGGGTDVYQSTVSTPAGDGFDVETLWVSGAGSTVLGLWTAVPQAISGPPRTVNSQGDSEQSLVHLGLISHGTFTALPTPTAYPLMPGLIAW